MKTREHWVDIVKGLGIILVVVGHAGVPAFNEYIYWFHMPLFFMISGYFQKSVSSWNELGKFIVNRTTRLLIPYFAFLAIVMFIQVAVVFYHDSFSLAYVKNLFLQLLWGGRELRGYFTVFWFITCLYFTQILFAAIMVLFKNEKVFWSSISVFYLMAHLSSWVYYRRWGDAPGVFWNVDVVLLAIVYFAIGYALRKYQFVSHLKSWKFQVVTISFFLFIMWCYKNQLLTFIFNMKEGNYQNLALDLVVPIVFSFLIFFIGLALEATVFRQLLVILGQESLIIMYLHVPINIVASAFIKYDWWTFLFLGVVIPVLTSKMVIQKYRLTSFLLLGVPLRKRTAVQATDSNQISA